MKRWSKNSLILNYPSLTLILLTTTSYITSLNYVILFLNKITDDHGRLVGTLLGKADFKKGSDIKQGYIAMIVVDGS